MFHVLCLPPLGIQASCYDVSSLAQEYCEGAGGVRRMSEGVVRTYRAFSLARAGRRARGGAAAVRLRTPSSLRGGGSGTGRQPAPRAEYHLVSPMRKWPRRCYVLNEPLFKLLNKRFAY